ncbi:MAG: type IV toxin-antitoxin system AbiEi family antitoxin domain-containing protein [Thermoleophilia bacterium]
MKPSDTALEYASKAFEDSGGIMRTSEALAVGIQPRTLYWMRDNGLLVALSRGVYHLTSLKLPAKPDVAAIMLRVPRAVLCLARALDYHEIGTRIPSSVQVALPRNVRPPRIAFPRIQVFHMDEASMMAGVEEQSLAGMQFRVFGVAKTVADCFKFRNSIGLDVAIEALQEVVRSRRASPADIMRYANIDRVESVIRPYLEALL